MRIFACISNIICEPAVTGHHPKYLAELLKSLLSLPLILSSTISSPHPFIWSFLLKKTMTILPSNPFEFPVISPRSPICSLFNFCWNLSICLRHVHLASTLSPSIPHSCACSSCAVSHEWLKWCNKGVVPAGGRDSFHWVNWRRAQHNNVCYNQSLSPCCM